MGGYGRICWCGGRIIGGYGRIVGVQRVSFAHLVEICHTIQKSACSEDDSRQALVYLVS